MNNIFNLIARIANTGICGTLGIYQGKKKIPEVLNNFTPEQVEQIKRNVKGSCARGS